MAKNEVAEKKQQSIITADLAADMAAQMDYSESESKDLLIPKVLLMQGSSRFVKDEQICMVGDLVKSTDGTVYGSIREKDYKPLKFVPIYMFKTWVKQERIPAPKGGNDKLQWVGTEPVTPENSNQQWEQEAMVDGQLRKYKLTKNINFYIMLEQDFNNALAIPHVLTFRGTSARGASILEDWFAKCRMAQISKLIKDEKGKFILPFAKVFELGGKMEKNEDDQSWFTLHTKESGYTTDEILTTAFNWYKTVSKSKHTDIDNSDDKTQAPAEVVPF